MRGRSFAAVVAVMAALILSSAAVAAPEGEQSDSKATADENAKDKKAKPKTKKPVQKKASQVAPPAAKAPKETASKPAPGPGAGKEKSGSETPVYTNEDLYRLFGPPPSAPEPKGEGTKETAAAEVDPLKALEDDQARREDRKVRTAEAEKAVADAQARLEKVKYRELAIANPYLPPPDDLTAEEQEAWKKKGSAEILRQIQEQKRQAQEDLDKAKARVESLKAGG